MSAAIVTRTHAASTAQHQRAPGTDHPLDRPIPTRAPLRVLTPLYSFAPGGVERIAARLHAAWRTEGVDARILLADASMPAPLPLDQISQVGPRAHRHGLTRFVSLLLGGRARIIADQPQLLFCAGNTYTCVAVALRMLVGRECPPIVAKISNCLVRSDMNPLVRLFYRKWLLIQGHYIDHFVGMAPAMRGEIARLVGVPQSRISVIEDPALSSDALARLAAARDGAVRNHAGRRYLAIGRLAPQKNFALLLDAFARIAQPDDRLTILGDGPERAALERRAEELGITAALRLPGHVEPLDAWLAVSDALVMSSDYEGVPAVIVEGLAAGLPIIATDCCVSMGDLLGHGTLGQLAPVGDAAALAEAMASVGPEHAATVAARRAAAARFTIEHATDKYLGLMRSLVAVREADVAATLHIPRSDPIPSRAA